MASKGDSDGCGCILLIIGAAILAGGGSLGEAIAGMAAGWVGMLVVIGVSAGIVLLIIRIIAGK